MQTTDIKASRIDTPDAWFLNAAPVSVLCVGDAVDVTTEVAWLLFEPRVDAIVPAVDDVEVVPGVDAGLCRVACVVEDVLPVVGVEGGDEVYTEAEADEDDEPSLIMVNSGLAFPESPNT
jgi:hypothetical protein